MDAENLEVGHLSSPGVVERQEFGRPRRMGVRTVVSTQEVKRY